MNDTDIKNTTGEPSEGDIDISEESTEKIKTSTPGVYTHKLKKTFSWEGKDYSELTLDFNKLTGKDILAIESELAATGRVLINPANSVEFCFMLAARAAGVNKTVIENLPLYDANALRSEAKLFLLYGA